MKKEFSSKYTKKASHVKRAKWLTIIFIAIILLFASAFMVHKYKKPQVLSSGLAPIESWFAERKNHLQKKLVKVKQVVTNQTETKPEIHFEFYTALPNMQIKAQEENKEANVAVVSHAKIFDAEKIKNDLENVIKKK